MKPKQLKALERKANAEILKDLMAPKSINANAKFTPKILTALGYKLNLITGDYER